MSLKETRVNKDVCYKVYPNGCLLCRPDNSSVLAVGCNKGVIIWHLDPLLLSARPSGSAVQVLEYPGHDPVASIDWSPDGSLLVSGSFADPTILVSPASDPCYIFHTLMFFKTMIQILFFVCLQM